MKQFQQMVREFMEKAGQECPDKPCEPNDKIKELRLNLIHEEFFELLVAMGYAYSEAFGIEKSSTFDYNLTEVADAIGDLLVVVLGTAVACGIDIEPIFLEIHRSNMTKFIDGHRREDGKWIKGPSYEPANLKPILWDQMHPKPYEPPCICEMVDRGRSSRCPKHDK